MTLQHNGAIRMLGKAAFFSTLARSLAIDEDVVEEDSIIWESGVDSALIIELVLVLEELGLDLPDNVQWDSVTYGELYRIYALAKIR
jgi:acyl carrier protein